MNLFLQGLFSVKYDFCRFFRLSLLIVLLAFSGLFRSGAAPMSGTYTVCNTTCSFNSINNALTSLKSNGVSGPVTISISSGKWLESLSIGAISGASSANTVTFKGAGRNSTIISSSSTVDTISGSYIVMRNMTLDYTGAKTGVSGTYISGTYNSFINCKLIASLGANNGDYNVRLLVSAAHNLFDSCYILGGAYGIYSNTTSGGASNNIFENSRVTQQYSYNIYMIYGTQNIFNHNYLDSSAQGSVSEYECGASYINNIFPGDNEQTALTIDYPNYTTQADTFNIINNIIGPNFISQGLVMSDAGAKSAINVNIYHNTIHSEIAVPGTGGGKICINGVCTGGSYYNFYMSDGCKGYNVKNNENSSTSGCNLWYCSNVANLGSEDGNNFYTTGGHFVNTTYSTLASYQAAVASYGFALHDENLTPVFVSSADMHYVQNVPEPTGVFCGVLSDIDGDPRCKLYPSAGADESNYGKGAFKAAIYGPTIAYVGSPTLFTNTALPGSPIIFAWYINGVFASDSISLQTNKLTAPGDSIKMVETGCTGTDSVTIYQVVDTPSKPPVTHFLSNANIVGQGETVSFRDLSTNGPSGWSWSISPDSTYDADLNAKVNTYNYISGSSNSENPQLQFLITGFYNVCLTASNARGAGNTVCKNRYIEVTPVIDMCATATSNAGSGVLYDNGGTGPTQTTSGAVCSFLLAPCSDTVYFVFDSFEMAAGNTYLRIYDGENNTGSVLNGSRSRQCTANTNTNGGPGFTGGANGSYPALACIPAIGDTFKALSGEMYFEYSSAGTYSSPGFRGHWWGHPKPFSPPKAKFSMSATNDSVCLGGSINFYADTTAGKDMTFLWDVDGDSTDGFEAGGKTTTYPYFVTGTYIVRLVASNCGGSDTFRQSITVYPPNAPVATFTADVTKPTTDDIVTFSPTEMMCIDDYRWAFSGPNGNLSQVTYVNGTTMYSEYPQVKFSDTGCWTVSLHEDNNFGIDSDLKTLMCYIHVKPPYCTPSVGFLASDIGFNNVVINTLSNPSNPITNDRTGYNDFTQTLNTTLHEGLKYTLSLSRATNFNPVDITVWVDWNGNGSFSDSGDLIFNLSNDPGNNWLDSNIIVPSNAALGGTVIRVGMNEGGLGNAVCGQNQYGDYEDYRLYIAPYNIPPVINLTGADTIYFNEGENYADPGYFAASTLYGVITNQVKLSWAGNTAYNKLIPGIYVLYYNLTDPSGNKAAGRSRVIVVLPDKLPPNLIVGCTGNPDTLFIEVNPSVQFQDPGICSSRDLVDGDVSDSVTEIGSVNTSVLGTYTLSYTSCDFSKNCVTKTRTVFVIDSIAPIITLNGPRIDTVNIFSNYVDAGANVKDNYWQNTVLTEKNNVNSNDTGTYYYTYYAQDSSGNNASPATRIVVVRDIEPPVLTLSGPDTVTVEVNTHFKDPGITGVDNLDKAVNIIEGGTFIKSFPSGTPVHLGVYSITYNATDAAGNAAKAVTRILNVVDDIPPVISLKGNDTNVCRWQPYQDAGYNVSDNYSKTGGPNKITVQTITNVDVSVPDIYYVYYVASDSVGNISTSLKRLVNVSEQGNCLSGINNYKSLGNYISIYPNPSGGEFVIGMDLPKEENVSITITNIMGEIVKQTYSVPGSGKQPVNLDAAAGGVYFVNITTDNESVTKKVTLTK